MGNYVITTCSTIDLTRARVKERNIHTLDFKFFINDEEYVDDMFEKMSPKMIYDFMANGGQIKTSQHSIAKYSDFFQGFLAQGMDVLHIALSSGISGTINSAKIAAKELREEYPDRKVLILDSLAASSGSGLLAEAAADLRDEGKTIDEAYDWLNSNKRKINHWFTATDLSAFIKGGRISKVSGWFGTMLKICPVLNVDNEGRLTPREKVRGKANALLRLADKMAENADGGAEYSKRCYICNSDCYEDAIAVKSLIEETFPNLKGKVLINYIGSTIGSHSGPGTVALFFFGKERNN